LPPVTSLNQFHGANPPIPRPASKNAVRPNPKPPQKPNRIGTGARRASRDRTSHRLPPLPLLTPVRLPNSELGTGNWELADALPITHYALSSPSHEIRLHHHQLPHLGLRNHHRPRQGIRLRRRRNPRVPQRIHPHRRQPL